MRRMWGERHENELNQSHYRKRCRDRDGRAVLFDDGNDRRDPDCEGAANRPIGALVETEPMGIPGRGSAGVAVNTCRVDRFLADQRHVITRSSINDSSVYTWSLLGGVAGSERFLHDEHAVDVRDPFAAMCCSWRADDEIITWTNTFNHRLSTRLTYSTTA